MADRYLFMMSRIQNRILGHIKQELAREGLGFSPGQMGILLALDNLPEGGWMLMGQLGQVLDMDGAALARLADSLEKKGLMRREINPENRRQIRAALTLPGRDRARTVKCVVQAVNRRIHEGFSQEEMAIYNRINEAILEKFN